MSSFSTRVSATLLAAVAGGFILAGCSSSDNSAPAARPAPTTTRPAPTTSPSTPSTSAPAAAPAVDPAQAAQPKKPAKPAKTLSPNGYGKLRFGMTEEQALATGEIVNRMPDQDGAFCLGYELKGHETPEEDWPVMISKKHGLVAIFAQAGMRTPEGIGAGSSFAKVKAAYPSLVAGQNGHSATIPGNDYAQYRFNFDEKNVLNSFFVERRGQDCYE